MSISAGKRLGPYEILAPIGVGGMGEVYRAHDTRLKRDVALKLLPESFADNPDRLARFTREAQVLASLNHPNIAALYGIEDSNGTSALVMELVEGPTLAERTQQGPIPVDEALQIARQIAEGLEYAHEKNVVHRDLKPANVKITPAGTVKILDFGLAKAFHEDPLTVPLTAAHPLTAAQPLTSLTLTMGRTLAGMILGTAGYMSPEQAKGKPVDRRADIWSFGVLLFEMLTGRTMYTGETVSETLASVIKDPVDLSGMPKGTPPAIRRLLKRCLDKDPQRRLQAIGEARIAIDGATAAEETPTPAPSASVPAAPVPAAPLRRRVPWWTVALAAVLPAAILGAFLWRATRPVDRPLQRFSADLGPDSVAGVRTSIALSPDGSRIVHSVRTSGGLMLATRLIGEFKGVTLSGTEDGVDPFFSPDGHWIGFFANGKLRKVSIQGGAPMELCDTTVPRGASWGADGYIYGAFDGLHLARVPEAGGTPQIVTKPEDRGERTHRWPQVLPGGESVLLTAAGIPGSTGSYEDANLAVYSLKTRQFKIVQRGGYYGRYLGSGHLVYIHQGTLFGVPFEMKRLEARGLPAPLLQDVAANSTQASGGQFAFSNNGILAYLSGQSGNPSGSVVSMDKAGTKQPLWPSPGGPVFTPRLSPDGKLLALSVDGDIFVYDPARGSSQRLTFSPAAINRFPVWTPDAKHIVYTAVTGGFMWVRSDGSGKPEPIYDKAGALPVAMSLSPDGKVLAFHEFGKDRDIFTLPLDLTDPDHPKAGKPEPFLTSAGADVDPAFSPDGRWLAYATNESRVYQVFVRPFPEGAQGGGQAQISSGSARFPVWSRAAKEIFYVAPDGRIMVVPYVMNGRAFSPGKPAVWSDSPIGLAGATIPLDIAPDGKRFAVFPGVETAAGGEKANLHITFLVNFFDELKRKMP